MRTKPTRNEIALEVLAGVAFAIAISVAAMTIAAIFGLIACEISPYCAL